MACCLTAKKRKLTKTEIDFLQPNFNQTKKKVQEKSLMTQKQEQTNKPKK